MSHPSFTRLCTTCGGSGVVVLERDGGRTDRVVCRTCAGEGRVRT